jgi:CheY-like chemotaxis protein
VSPRILVADDDEDNRTIAHDALEAAGFEVLQASDGEEAVEKALRELPDVVILDLAMPKLSGWDAAGRIRRGLNGRPMVLIAFTAHAMRGDDRKALDAGCDDYLPKPCLPSRLVAKVREWVPAPAPADGTDRKGGPRGDGAGAV